MPISVSILTAAALAAASLAPVTASAKRPRRATVDVEASSPSTPPTATPPAGAPAEAPAATPVDESSFPSTPGRARRMASGGHCRLSLAASSPQIISGETVTLTGALSCGDVASQAREPVTIFQRLREGGASVLSEVGTATTGPDGSYQFTPSAFDVNSVFVVRSPVAHGAHVAVKVAPAVTIQGPPAGAQLFTRGNAGAHNRMTFTGTVSPADEGALVALQRQYAASGEQWRTIAFARVGAEGRYSVTHGFRTPGEVSVRVVVRPKGPNRAAVSEALSYTVAQTQNPRLTIQTSVDPVSFGQSITITGVAAGQSVTLLARTPGHSYAVVGKAATDTGGAYSFTVSPLQNTYYRVASATTVSSQLFEGYRYELSTGPAPQTVQDGSPLTFAGTLLGAPEGQLVRLEQQYASGIGFHAIAEGTLDATSSYSIAYTFAGLAQRVLRIRVPANAQSVGSTSAPFTLTVTPKTAPAGETEAPSAGGGEAHS